MCQSFVCSAVNGAHRAKVKTFYLLCDRDNFRLNNGNWPSPLKQTLVKMVN